MLGNIQITALLQHGKWLIYKRHQKELRGLLEISEQRKPREMKSHDQILIWSTYKGVWLWMWYILEKWIHLTMTLSVSGLYFLPTHLIIMFNTEVNHTDYWHYDYIRILLAFNVQNQLHTQCLKLNSDLNGCIHSTSSLSPPPRSSHQSLPKLFSTLYKNLHVCMQKHIYLNVPFLFKN